VTWTDLSDDELLRRLIQRAVLRSVAEYLVEHREKPWCGVRINELLDGEVAS